MSDIPVHQHSDGRCPVTGISGSNPHPFCPPQPGDTRAPCPALNTMANHGYLPRDGKALTADIIIDALIKCYKLSKPLAWLLTHGALFLLDQGGKELCLSDLARHNGVEHNASLYHPDAGYREEYAPIHGDEKMLREFFEDSKDGLVMNTIDVSRVRARREGSYPEGQSLDFIHAELARGEMAIVLNCFNNPNLGLVDKGVPLQHRSTLSKFFRSIIGRRDTAENTPLNGVPVEILRYWFQNERLPPGWQPYHKTSLRSTISTINTMRSAMRKFAKELPKKAESTHASAPKPILAIIAEPVSSLPVEGDALNAREDNTNVLTLPDQPSHSQYPSASSATSSTFTDVLHTPETSDFQIPPSITPKDAVSHISPVHIVDSDANGKVPLQPRLPIVVEPPELGITDGY
ncbi:heme-thiolate peroxidase [Hermanssonia centrifuga]|uniref:Heme-thiolate peroxidase n=1 Tax=Hermanssonia centrifuga TaxID=98765 RepID=A0A4V3XA70_9APHY|nr:heme-thiolate peroxidase [Hermanssonia centrifuga]